MSLWYSNENPVSQCPSDTNLPLLQFAKSETIQNFHNFFMFGITFNIQFSLNFSLTYYSNNQSQIYYTNIFRLQVIQPYTAMMGTLAIVVSFAAFFWITSTDSLSSSPPSMKGSMDSPACFIL